MRPVELLIYTFLLFASSPLIAATPHSMAPGGASVTESPSSTTAKSSKHSDEKNDADSEVDEDGMPVDDASVIPPANRYYKDNPDAVKGPQIHFIYAVPKGGVDHGLDLTTTIPYSASSFNRWLASQTGGRKLRFDVYRHHLDITYVKLTNTDATYETDGVFKRDHIEADLKQLGVLRPNKIYAVYYDGVNPRTCADSPLPPGLPGQVVVIYLRGLEGVPGVRPCADNPFAARPSDPPGYQEFVALHEIVHAQGIVSVAAPNYTLNGHVSDSPTDLMYAGTLPWAPSVLDFNKDDYYNPNGLPSGVINLANSPFLTRRHAYRVSD